MKRYNPRIILTMSSVILGIIISTLMKANVEYYVPVTIKSLQNTQNEISVIKNEIAELNTVIEEKQKELETMENVSQGDQDIIDILAGDLKYNRSIAGNTQLEGPGISIRMQDNSDTQIVGFDIEDDVIHDVDILNILNDLKIAGAEAISINGERVISNSEIKCGGPIIRINGKSLATPFIIEAIGDPKLLMASVNAPGTYGDTLKNVYAIGFEMKVKDKIVIPAYTGRFSFKYAKPKGEGDI